MTNETNELKTYTMQQLYAQPLEPVEYLVDGLLAPGLYILGGSPEVAAMHFAGTTALPGVLSAGAVHRPAPWGTVCLALAGPAWWESATDPTFPQHGSW